MGFYLNEMSQKINPIKIAKQKIVPMTDMRTSLDSYFKCMKNMRTRLDLREAIKIAIQMLRIPRSILETMTVIDVSPIKAASTRASFE